MGKCFLFNTQNHKWCEAESMQHMTPQSVIRRVPVTSHSPFEKMLSVSAVLQRGRGTTVECTFTHSQLCLLNPQSLQLLSKLHADAEQ